MKRNIILTGIMLLVAVMVSAQTYNMIVEKTDGSTITIPTSSISQISFQKEGGGEIPSGTGTFQGAKRVFGDNLMKMYAYQSSSSSNGKSWDYTYDSNGYITRTDYADGYSSSYATIDYSGGSVVVFKSFDKADGSLISQAVINIGSNGYASSYSYTDDKGRANKIDLTYNSDEQITNIVCYRNGAKSWGYSFEYSDGDLVKATELGWENDVLTDNEVCANILYETSTQSKIDNVGGVMEYNHMMHIDCGLDEIFPFGALGKPSKHLPLLVTWGSSTINNSYTFDSAGRPTSATSARTSSSGSQSTYNITWAWDNNGGSTPTPTPTPTINANDLLGTWKATTSEGIENVTLNEGNSSWQVFNSSGSIIRSGIFTWTLTGNTINFDWISGDIDGAATSAVVSNVTSNSFTAVTNLSKTYNFTRNTDDTGDDTSLYKIAFNDGYKDSYNSNGFILTCNNGSGKMTVDQTGQPYFGTAENYQKYSSRLKPGGNSSESNSLSLTIPYAGTLKIAARASSSSAMDRNLVLTQNGTTILDRVVKENESTDYETTEIEGVSYKIFPIISVPVKAGTVDITYPNGSINFHCFEFIKAEDSGSGGETPSGTGTFQGAKRVFGDNLMKKYAYQSSSSSNGKSWDYTYDSNGYITRADYADGYSSSYATIDYSGGSVVVFKSFDKANGSLISQAVINIGSNGYASSYSYTDDKGRANKIDLTYNSDEQITNIVCYRNGAKSWGYDFEYSDGDLVKATELGWENDVLTDNEVCANILYETSTQSKIDNVGGVMEYNHMMHIDCGLDEIFPFGALGKPSKHLPLLVTWGSSTINNSYTLDSAGRPTSATSARTSSSGSQSTYNITWAW